MTRVFISYRFSGEDKDKLKKTIMQVHNFIGKAGHEHYSTIFDTDQFTNENWSGKKIMEKAFKEIDSSDVVLFFVRSPKISQGMLIELGYSLANKKKIILAIKENIKDSVFRRQIEEVIEFKNMADLKNKLCGLEF